MTGDAQPLVHAPLTFRQRNGGKQSKSDALVTCPKCDAPCFIRRSERLTETVKHLVAHCTNTACAMTFQCELAVIQVYSPGLIDRPDLDLPMCPREQVPHCFPPAAKGKDGEGGIDQISMFENSG